MRKGFVAFFEDCDDVMCARGLLFLRTVMTRRITYDYDENIIDDNGCVVT